MVLVVLSSGVETLIATMHLCQRVVFKLPQNVQQPLTLPRASSRHLMLVGIRFLFCNHASLFHSPSWLEKGRGLRACYVSGCNRCCSKGTVVLRAMDDCEVCYIKTYLKEVQMNL